MRGAIWAVLVGLVLSPLSSGADPKTKKQLVGRWALVESRPPAADAKVAPAKKAAGKKAAVAKKAAGRKGAAGAKTAPEIPKFVLEFTDDGKVRLDGDTSILGGTFRFLKPLADFHVRVAPQAQYIKISYEVTDDDKLEVMADHSALLEKGLAGARESLPPEKMKELLEQYHPRETLKVAMKAGGLTLTNERGESRTFRRHAGGTLAELEGKQREQELRKGLAPFQDILKQQGINVRP
jgi:hypothetical protein